MIGQDDDWHYCVMIRHVAAFMSKRNSFRAASKIDRQFQVLQNHSCSLPVYDNFGAAQSTKGEMLGLGIIFKALLLVINAMAVIHEERFLKKGMAT